MYEQWLEYLEEERALCVKAVDVYSTEPKRVTWWWPIMTDVSKANAEIYALGHKLGPYNGTSDGRYCYSYDPTLPPGAHRTVFHLVNGGRTQAIKIEEETIPPPKVRKGVELRWKDGRWQKYLKREGWVNA